MHSWRWLVVAVAFLLGFAAKKKGIAGVVAGTILAAIVSGFVFRKSGCTCQEEYADESKCLYSKKENTAEVTSEPEQEITLADVDINKNEAEAESDVVIQESADIHSFTIDNITENDIKTRIFRIGTANKPFFPEEIRGNPKNHTINIVFEKQEMPATYRIGSKDGKIRSGVISFLAADFKSMNLSSGNTLVFEVLEPEKKFKVLKDS